MNKYFDSCEFWEKKENLTIKLMLDLGWLEGECGSCKYCCDSMNCCLIDRIIEQTKELKK